jgi:hypothetical protein
MSSSSHQVEGIGRKPHSWGAKDRENKNLFGVTILAAKDEPIGESRRPKTIPGDNVTRGSQATRLGQHVSSI